MERERWHRSHTRMSTPKVCLIPAILLTDSNILTILAAMGYLRAVMASQERTHRVLTLTEHIISLNAAHYPIWLYRASTLFALSSSIPAELTWLNDIALDNQKNYQIWHH